MSRNAQPLLKPPLLSHVGVRVDDPAHHMRQNIHSEPKGEGSRLRRLENSHNWELPPQAPWSTTTMGRANRHPQVKQYVPDSSFVEAVQSPYGHIPATLRSTAFPPGTVTQGWNSHAYGISATMSVSGSPRSDIIAMSIDEDSLASGPYRKTSSKMSVDSPLTGTRRKTSSKMSVDPSSPNVYYSTQRRTSSRMLIDVPSARRTRGSSDRMLLDEIQYHYQNLPQQAHVSAPFTAHPTAWPTTGTPHSASTYSSQEYTLTGVSPFPMTVSQKRYLSHGTRSPRGDAKLTPIPLSPPPSSFMQHIQGKHKNNTPVTSIPPLPCTLKSPASATVLPLRRTDPAPTSPPKIVSPKHETPASRQSSRCPSAKRETIHSTTSSGRVRARGSSSGDEVSHKRYCARQSPPIALLAIDPRSTHGPSLRPAQSLSPIDEIQSMEQQLETARQSQLKVKFGKFKVIIGGAVNEIKQAIMPYNKDHRKRKTSRTCSGSRSFAGVPDYLRSAAERFDSPKLPSAPRYNQRTSFDIRKDIDTIAETWMNLGLCDSPISLHGDDGTVQGEARQLSLPLPKINEPPRSSRSSRPTPGTGNDSITKIQSDDKVEIYVGTTATNLAAPTFHRHRTADAFDARGVVIPPLPNNDRKSSRSTKM